MNKDHYAKLQEGVSSWNQWRLENPAIYVHFSVGNLSVGNLSEADLSEADLRGADLRGANLIGADLSEANLSVGNLSRADLIAADLSGVLLSGADLSGADLRGADLSGADLGGADLSGADLGGAELSGANLSEANLSGANLSVADLSRADLSRATIGYTILGDVDLRLVQGLDTVRHVGPSTIGIDTIYRSQGEIPESLLRGAGVPDVFIEQMHALVGGMRPIEFYSCFISYSSKDEDFAKRLHADLQARQVRCWFAPEDMKIGDKIRDSIDRAIQVHDKLLVVLSESSVDSDWVEDEVDSALEQERKRRQLVLFPIRLDQTVMESSATWAAKIRRQRHIGDFRAWKDHDSYQEALDRLIRDLQREAGAEDQERAG